MSEPMFITGLLAVFILCWFAFKVLRIGRRESFLPPGPPTIPLLGNLHVFPNRDVHLQFTKWAQQYGDIYSLKLGLSTAIVLTSPAIIREILDKNSNHTSDRPANHIASQVTGDNHLVLANYSSTWRSLRRGAHEILTPQSCQKHLPIQHAEAAQLSYDLLKEPNEFAKTIRRYSYSVILSVLYGKRVPRHSSPGATVLFEMLHRWVSLTAPGAHPPVDMVPILKMVPERFALWKSICKEVRSVQRKLYFGLLNEMESRTAQGAGNGCFMETVCERAGEWGLDRELISYLGGVLIEAGTDTTAAFIQSLILLVMANPEVQRKARKEIDAVVGPDRMPTLSDIEHLPYIQAVINETHRYRPVAPLGVPHATTAELTYGKYVIPKGAIIFSNTWGIFHDQKGYNDPERYNPDRFVQSDPENAKTINLVFGSGRRICPGMHLAKNSIAINAMSLLWGFDFGKARDEKGDEIGPDVWDYEQGLAVGPNPFNCVITPRSAQHEDTIRRELHTSREAFLPYEHDLCAEDKGYLRELRQKIL